MTQKTKEEMAKVTAYLPYGLWQKAKIAALVTQVTVSQFVQQAIEEALDKKTRK